MREMLSRGLVFELPVPREALAAVCDTIPIWNIILVGRGVGTVGSEPDEALTSAAHFACAVTKMGSFA
jgi:hypothetical protein